MANPTFDAKCQNLLDNQAWTLNSFSTTVFLLTLTDAKFHAKSSPSHSPTSHPIPKLSVCLLSSHDMRTPCWFDEYSTI